MRGFFLITLPFDSPNLAGTMTMEVDDTNSYLVTGDADGVVKVWDIMEYCLRLAGNQSAPPRKSRDQSRSP